MTQTANFEEKTYESFFNQEIALKTNSIIWFPGQCQENWLGFDAATYLPLPVIFNFLYLRQFRLRRIQQGLSLGDQEWKEFFDVAGDVLPSFKVNIFIQYKRPEYVTGHNAHQWAC